MDFKNYLSEMSVATPKSMVRDINQAILQLRDEQSLTITIKRHAGHEYDFAIKGE
jgi:hypothetical protein